MKRLLFLAILLLGMAETSLAQNALTAADTNIPQGGQGQMVVSFQFANEGEIAAYQFDLALPEGVSLIPNGKRYLYEKGDGYNDAHQISINYVESEGVYVVVCAATSSTYGFSVTSGTLITFPLQADESLDKGTTMSATLKNIRLSTKGASNVTLNDVSFRIVIGEPSDIRTELFETSTEMPAPEANVNVRVYRTINANEWSTICLPFAMTEQQVKDAFGDDVQLGDFNDYEFDEVAGTISVNFENVTAIVANHPYIIKVSEVKTEFTVDGVDINPVDEPMVNYGTKRKPRAMVGTFVAGTTLEYGCLFLSGNNFWYSVGSTEIKAFRAYFNFIDLLPEFEENYEEARISMTFEDITGIVNIEQSLLNNVQSVYDLQGRWVEKPVKKGLYIKNGKKEVIR